MVRYIGNDVFIRKYAKLNIFLICMHKSKVTLNMKKNMFTSRVIIIYPIVLIRVK